MPLPLASPAMNFEHVLVVGAGQMGGGIAQVVAASGRRVSLHDAAPGATERGLVAMRKSLEKLAEKGGGDPDKVLGRVSAVDELVAADLLIEAVIEDARVKEEIFRRADEVLPEAAILASNTSSIPITSLAAVTGRPDRVIGMHFFNPVPVLKLVEVIRAVQTSDETAAAIVALAAMEKSLTKLAEKGGPAAEDVLARVTPVDDLVAADLLVEAVVEDSGVKEAIFRRADAALPPHAILASNTSSIPITSLAAVTGRPDKVIGMHFFNPVPVLKLVEVIRALQTSDETAAAIVALAEDLGKTPAQANDFPGFVSNRILMPFVNEAAYALMEGVAEAEAIDTIAKLGFAHPLGPLALADLIGLDTCTAIMDVLHQGLGNPKYAPCPLLRQYVAAGRLGRKSGRGFYEYG